MKKTKRLTVEEAIEVMASGGMIIMTDHETRENEGDLVGAVRFAEPEMINFMASKGKGLICCALEDEICDQAGLSLLEDQGPEAMHGTRFCTPIDLIDGCTTGISAGDRSRTLKQLISPECDVKDFARPGHMFPIREASGGLRVRQGHTEASIALCRAAGLEGAAVICEIMDDDGTMARWDRLNQMGCEWEMGILTIDDLIQWTEKRAHSHQGVRLPTSRGDFSMEIMEPLPGETGGDSVCLVKSLPQGKNHPDGPLVRIHSECMTGDLFGSQRCDCGEQLRISQELIDQEDQGYLIYLRQEGRGIGLKAKLAAYQLQDGGMDTVEANLALGHQSDSRQYGPVADFLIQKGHRSIRLLTNNPDKIEQLEERGLKITRVPLLIQEGEENKKYLDTKFNKMGHLV